MSQKLEIKFFFINITAVARRKSGRMSVVITIRNKIKAEWNSSDLSIVYHTKVIVSEVGFNCTLENVYKKGTHRKIVEVFFFLFTI